MAVTTLSISSEAKEFNIEGAVYEGTETMSTAGNGNTFVFPEETGRVESVLAAMIISTGGTGKIQTTISAYADVVAETTSVNWVDWRAGNVSASRTDTFYHVTGVRQINSTGVTILEIKAS